ncbi:MAG TPA: aquaporin [Candidatus Thermoplasmatota archaeon]|nr:aquaporin [Candidatus Thermoplasmatota archaeon]
MANTMAKQVTAEFIGTFTLVFLGVGAILHGAAGLLGVALAHGLAIVVMVTALGHISGGQFNPAVTAGLVTSGRMKLPAAGAYIVAQIAGALAGALLMNVIFRNITGGQAAIDATHLGTPALADAVSPGIGLLIEIVLTFFLVLVVHGIVDERQTTRTGGLIIGLTVAADILMGGPLTGAAMNPARWFGTAAVNGFWDNAWVYIVGPLAGGIAAGALYGYFLHDRPVAADRK